MVSRSTDVASNGDEIIGAFKNANSECCSGKKQPTKNKHSIMLDMLNQLNLDKDNPNHKNPTHITSKLTSIKDKRHLSKT